MRQQSKLQMQLTTEEFTTSDPTTIYQSTYEAEEDLKEEVSKNVRLKFGKMRDQLNTFPVNQAVWGIFMNRCMWAVLHFSKDDEELRRILKNMKYAKSRPFLRRCKHN